MLLSRSLCALFLISLMWSNLAARANLNRIAASNIGIGTSMDRVNVYDSRFDESHSSTKTIHCCCRVWVAEVKNLGSFCLPFEYGPYKRDGYGLCCRKRTHPCYDRLVHERHESDTKDMCGAKTAKKLREQEEKNFEEYLVKSKAEEERKHEELIESIMQLSEQPFRNSAAWLTEVQPTMTFDLFINYVEATLDNYNTVEVKPASAIRYIGAQSRNIRDAIEATLFSMYCEDAEKDNFELRFSDSWDGWISRLRQWRSPFKPGPSDPMPAYVGKMIEDLKATQRKSKEWIHLNGRRWKGYTEEEVNVIEPRTINYWQGIDGKVERRRGLATDNPWNINGCEVRITAPGK